MFERRPGVDSTDHPVEEAVQGSGTWGDWTAKSDTVGKAVTDPTVFPFTNGSGPGWALVVRDANNATTVVPHQADVAPTAFTLPAPPA